MMQSLQKQILVGKGSSQEEVELERQKTEKYKAKNKELVSTT
jgi:hypothetical protein